MKLSKHVRHSKRGKHTKRTKYIRHTKHRGKQYKNKRTYRKHPRKLKHKSRLQKGGYNDIDIVDRDTFLKKQIMISYTKTERSGLFGIFKNPSRKFMEPFEVTVELTKISGIPFTYNEYLEFIQQPEKPDSRVFRFVITLSRMNKNLKFNIILTKKAGSGSTTQLFKQFVELSIPLFEYEGNPLPKELTLTSTDKKETYTFTDFYNILWNINNELPLDNLANEIQQQDEYLKVNLQENINRRFKEYKESGGEVFTKKDQLDRIAIAEAITRNEVATRAVREAEQARANSLYSTQYTNSSQSPSSGSDGSYRSSSSANGAADVYT